MKLKYNPFEKLKINRPVKRLDYISDLCEFKDVLDIGSYDETAINEKRMTGNWLHSRIIGKSRNVIGIDSSELFGDCLETAPNAKIIKMNAYDIDSVFAKEYPINVIIVGEVIEHMEDVSKFLSHMRNIYPGKKLIMSTPNATSITNVLLALFKRESNHKDHIHLFSYKTLYTVCKKNDLRVESIQPTYSEYPEMKFRVKGIKRYIVIIVEKIINIIEYLFPMLSAGYTVEVYL